MWRRTVVVSFVSHGGSKRFVLRCCRTIVPIYQSEVSPPTHVRCSHLFALLESNELYLGSEAHLRAWSLQGISLAMPFQS